jgi:hypothetical protein
LGATARVFAQLPGISAYAALEPDADLVARMRQQAAAGGFPPGFEAIAGTIESLPPGRRFDSILYIDVLEHIADDRGELQRATGRLRVGGHLVVLAPAHQWLFSPFDAAIGHYRRYTRRTLAAVAPPALEQIRIDYLDAVGIVLSLGNRAALRQRMPGQRQVMLWDRLAVPISRRLDPLLRYRAGKSVLAVWRRTSG